MEEQDVLFLKPMTYMNLSGKAVGAFSSWYRLDPADILIIYDDTDLAVGKLRLRKQGRSGGHRGLESVIDRLGMSAFPRLRIGIGERPKGMHMVDYVLSEFFAEEEAIVAQTLDRACAACGLMFREGLEKAMNEYNG